MRRLSALLLMLPLPLLAEVDGKSNVVDLPAGSVVSVVQPVTIRGGISFAQLGGNDSHTCFLGSVEKFPPKMQAPRFERQSDDRKFRPGEAFTLVSVDGMRRGKVYQAYTLRLRHASGGRFVLFLEQTGPEVGFTSVNTLLNACGKVLKVE